MSLLVTGATGQLGREWGRFLSGRSMTYTAAGRAELDITDRGGLHRYLDRLKPRIVINCAAYTAVDRAEQEPEVAMKVNSEGVAFLAEWCEKEGAKLIHYSTDYVFQGAAGDRHTYPDGYPEEAPPAPVNSYGESKCNGEERLKRSGADFLLLRICWLCGRYGNNFVRTMLRLGREKRKLKVVDDQMGSPTWAREIPAVTWRLIEADNEGIYHYTSAGLTSWYGLAAETFRTAGMEVDLEPVSTAEYPTPARRPLYSKLSTEKLRRTLGVKIDPWQLGLKPLVRAIQKEII